MSHAEEIVGVKKVSSWFKEQFEDMLKDKEDDIFPSSWGMRLSVGRGGQGLGGDCTPHISLNSQTY